MIAIFCLSFQVCFYHVENSYTHLHTNSLSPSFGGGDEISDVIRHLAARIGMRRRPVLIELLYQLYLPVSILCRGCGGRTSASLTCATAGYLLYNFVVCFVGVVGVVHRVD